VKVTLWGTRGSQPAAGPETVRYGGNTACVEVRGADGTVLVLDAGTGIRRLGAALRPKLSRLDLLLTHLHMDHIQGLGFVDSLYQADLDVHIWGPASTTLDLRERLTRYLSPPLFPVRMRDLPCRLTLHNVPFGTFEISGLAITADLVCHPGPTVGYRITEGSSSIAYMPDHEPALGAQRFPEDPDWTSGFALASGADLLIHDAQYSDTEYEQHTGWGHSSIRHALEFAAATSVRRLVTFHHDPAHDDATLDELHEQGRQLFNLPFELAAGIEGASFELGAGPADRSDNVG
jgi:phosphoribosyl 1,2-cyclic phosphodiesterase